MNGAGDGGYKRRASYGPAVVGNSSSLAYRLMWVTVACLAFSILVFVFRAHRAPVAFVSYLYGDMPQRRVTKNGQRGGELDPSSESDDGLLGGLLAAGEFNAESCLSRHEAILYRRASPWKPSSYLVQRLRNYEARHKLCAPNTESYNISLRLLQSGNHTGTLSSSLECKYIVWTPRDGLGNRMLSLASAFVYTLLTGRVLLIDKSKDMADLFCEPFQGSSWLLPPDFPLSRFHAFDRNHPQSYGNMLRNNRSFSGGQIPGFVYVHLAHDYDDDDEAFFWESGKESPLLKIPWMLMKSNQYFVPALFLNPAFERELHRLFPEKEAVFHHLGRYLFHPTNQVWGLITRYYRAYLAMAEERIGIQIRVFNKKTSPFEVVLDQILNCTQTEKLLPEVKQNKRKKKNLPEPVALGIVGDYKRPLKAVLLTSLSSGYLERIKDTYWEQPAAGGRAEVSVHQPSHEEWQQTGRGEHDMKALAEMYLLSLSDTLVTSAWSTFGYVAQSLGGLRPWILLTPRNGSVPEPACVRAMSEEPCFHFPPCSYDCRAKRHGEARRTVPYVQRCEDAIAGIKLVEQSH